MSSTRHLRLVFTACQSYRIVVRGYPQSASRIPRGRQLFPPCAALPNCYAFQTMRVSEAFAPFINYCQSERHVADSTLGKYRECLRCWLLPWFGDRELGAVR